MQLASFAVAQGNMAAQAALEFSVWQRIVKMTLNDLKCWADRHILPSWLSSLFLRDRVSLYKPGWDLNSR